MSSSSMSYQQITEILSHLLEAGREHHLGFPSGDFMSCKACLLLIVLSKANCIEMYSLAPPFQKSFFHKQVSSHLTSLHLVTCRTQGSDSLNAQVSCDKQLISKMEQGMFT